MAKGNAVVHDQLTVCSVFYDAFTLACLRLNVGFTNSRNVLGPSGWIVADNSPSKSLPDGRPEEVEIVQGPPPDPAIPAPVRGSYQHGRALNSIITRVETRYALVLDCDFFIVQPDWASNIVEHAATGRLAFFGAPWHPRWFNKYRGFPCVHCLLIDLAVVDPGDLDFQPDLVDDLAAIADPVDGTGGDRIAASQGRLRTVANNLRSIILLRDRATIRSSRDTGIHLYDRFGNDRTIRFECLQPVFRPHQHFVGPRHARGALNRLVERLLPERLCFFPKRSETYSETGFRDVDLYDADALGWEEFLWQGSAFGFHLRGFQNRRDDRQSLQDLETALATFTL
ncbi:MAG: hypothetical protein ACC649_01475 [Myxococcota bacterium]